MLGGGNALSAHHLGACDRLFAAYLAYRAPGHQRALKPLDFSRVSIEERVAGEAPPEDAGRAGRASRDRRTAPR